MPNNTIARTFLASLLNDERLTDVQVSDRILEVISAGLTSTESDAPKRQPVAVPMQMPPAKVSRSLELGDTCTALEYVDLLNHLNGRIEKEMSDYPPLSSAVAVEMLWKKAGADMQLVQDAMTIAVDYHRRGNGIKNIVGFLSTVLSSNEPESVKLQAEAISAKRDAGPSEMEQVILQSEAIAKEMRMVPASGADSLSVRMANLMAQKQETLVRDASSQFNN